MKRILRILMDSSWLKSTLNQFNNSGRSRKMDNALVKKAPHHYGVSPIMDSLDYQSAMNPVSQNIRHSQAIDFKSLDMNAEDIDTNGHSLSFLLLDEKEKLKVSGAEQFITKLKIQNDMKKVKVISIFGNTGEGKSHTLNHTFFGGREVFKTSPAQSSCTLGVWAAYDPKLEVIVLDTEGLLGITIKESQRTRLLLKVLAVSDVIIYRTRTDRLQRDMYTFLSGASKAYKDHFQTAIQQVWKKTEHEMPPVSVGPSVIIFHETKFTETLQSSASVMESPEDILRARFAELSMECDSFSSLKYVGIQTKGVNVTSFSELENAIQLELDDTTVRSKRNPKVIYLTLKGLNDKFSSEIKNTPPHLYLKEYFTCQMKCQSCNEGCTLSMGHKEEGEPHFSTTGCKFQHQYQNCVYLCKHCHIKGERVIVKPHSFQEQSWSSLFNYVWSGYVIECRNCGEIYRSRQHWYGNKDPEESAVRAEIVHIWPGERNYIGTHNSGQRIIDGVTTITDAVASVTLQPKQAICDWMTDKIAPSYWKPNEELIQCHNCNILFGTTITKHHCRMCGEGFCDQCSSKQMPVPSKGWNYNVRVCDDCYDKPPPILNNGADDTDLRKYGEAVVSLKTAVASVLEIPKGIIKETARPAYWTPDNECNNCEVCRKEFGLLLTLHHCRDCGKGVCDECSSTKKPVAWRGWYDPVRVCDNCLRK